MLFIMQLIDTVDGNYIENSAVKILKEILNYVSNVTTTKQMWHGGVISDRCPS